MEKYTVDYYKSINSLEKDQAEALCRAVTKLYNPRSVIDIGCGTGLYLAPFTCEKVGFDLSEEAFSPEVLQVNRSLVYTNDLRKRENAFLINDVALCLEVVEHIGSEHADTIVANIGEYADTIILTAAPPGQAGLNHVNCQPQQYWEEKFAKYGFKRDYHDEYQIVSEIVKTPHSVWIIRNLMVFKR